LGFLRCISLLFGALFCLKVNSSKSFLFPISEVPHILDPAEFCGFGVDYLPSSYLGLPLGAPFKCKAEWEPIVEMFHKRLAGWESELLSRGGRLTLLLSTLWSLHIYFVSLFTVPASIAAKLGKLTRDFLWLGDESNISFSLGQL